MLSLMITILLRKNQIYSLEELNSKELYNILILGEYGKLTHKDILNLQI